MSNIKNSSAFERVRPKSIENEEPKSEDSSNKEKDDDVEISSSFNKRASKEENSDYKDSSLSKEPENEKVESLSDFDKEKKIDTNRFPNSSKGIPSDKNVSPPNLHKNKTTPEKEENPSLLDSGISFLKQIGEKKKQEKKDFIKKALGRENSKGLSKKSLLDVAKIEQRQNSLIPLPTNDLVGDLLGEMYYDVLIIFFRVIEGLQNHKLKYFPIFGYTACRDSRGKPRLRKVYNGKIKFMSSPDTALMIASLEYILRQHSDVKLDYSLTDECTKFLDSNEKYDFNVVYSYFGDLRKVVQIVKNLHKKVTYAPSTASMHSYFSPFRCNVVRGVCVFGSDSLNTLKSCKRYLKKCKDFYVEPKLKISDL